MQADRDSNDVINLYDSLWAQFESDFWVTEQTRGRLKRPRLDWFIQTVLQVEFREEVDISKLYSAYQQFAKGKTSSAQLQILDKYAIHYQALLDGDISMPIGRFGKKIELWDASTTHPLSLIVLTSSLSDEDQDTIYRYLISYFIRRGVCGLTAKNYNRVFSQLIKHTKKQINQDLIYTHLASLEGDATRWPRDDEFKKEWIESEIYKKRLDSKKLNMLLLEIEIAMRSTRSEEVLIENNNLDIEHILPDKWHEHWPLSDGIFANEDELNKIDINELENNPKFKEIAYREKYKNTIGNLTLLHKSVNRSLQNYAFAKKVETIFAESNLHLNRELLRADAWNEQKITSRAEKLFEYASTIWAGPEGKSNWSWFIDNTLSHQNNKQSFDTQKQSNVSDSNEGAWITKGVIFPAGTSFRAEYKGRIFKAEVKDNLLVLNDGTEFTSPSSAAT